MRVEQITLLLLLAVAVKNIECSRHHDFHARGVKHHHNFKYHSCEQRDCEKCLSLSSQCQWCSSGSKKSKCVEIRGSDITDCPQGLKPTTCEPKLQADEKTAKIAHNSYYDKSLDELEAMDTPRMNNSEQNSDFNASAFCGRQSECNNCTENDFCLWCASKQECQVFSNSSTTANSCPEENNAYHRQCIYPSKCFNIAKMHVSWSGDFQRNSSQSTDSTVKCFLALTIHFEYLKKVKKIFSLRNVSAKEITFKKNF